MPLLRLFALRWRARQGSETAPRNRSENLADSGVSLHIYGGSGEQGREYLRFDCFVEEPHYHYVGWSRKSNEVLQIDPVADGDALAWALERLRTRLPQMLVRAGAADIAALVDPLLIEAILPRVAEAAYRARYRDRQDAPTSE